MVVLRFNGRLMPVAKTRRIAEKLRFCVRKTQFGVVFHNNAICADGIPN